MARPYDTEKDASGIPVPQYETVAGTESEPWKGEDDAAFVHPRLYNGATWDRQCNNKSGTLLATLARTATPTAVDQVNYNARGIVIIIDVTAVANTPSVVFTIEGKDIASGKYYTILASAAITGTGTTVLRVYPGLTAAANVTVSDILPRDWRLVATHADADSITYSVGYSYVL